MASRGRPSMASSSPPPLIRRYHVQRPLVAALTALCLPGVRASGQGHPVIALAQVDPTGFYRVPDGFVVLHQRFNAGYIILSFVIAVVGSLCTLELLIRRTSNRGLQNRLLLLAAGICFGAVSTFAMHFIGNNSLSLHHPQERLLKIRPLYLTYNPGWTVLSIVVSCTVMTLAFFIMGYELRGLRFKPKSNSKTDGDAAPVVSPTDVDVYSQAKASWKIEKEQAALQRVDKLRRGVAEILHRSAKVASWTMLDSGRFTTAVQKQTLGEKQAASKQHTFDREEAEFRGVIPKRQLPLQEIKLSPLVSSASISDAGPSPTEIEMPVAAPAAIRAPPPPPLALSPVMASVRRGSLPFALQQGPPPSPSSVFFTPGFSFPPQAPPTAATAVPAPGPYDSTPPWMKMPDAVLNPSYSMADPPVDAKVSAFRRASLPAVSFPQTAVGNLERDRERESTYPRSGGLTRIQSLSEHENDLQLSPGRLSRADDDDGDDDGEDEQEQQERVRAVLETVPRAERKMDARALRRQRIKAWLAAFLGLDVVTKGEIVKIVITGFIAGCGIAGMHYIGQRSITGMPYIAYKIRFVVASVIIACAAVIVALYIMFIMLRPKLKHSWFAKVGVAFVLGIAVCLMHYTAMGGTIYAWDTSAVPPESAYMAGNKRAIIAVVASLAFAACIGIGIFAIIASRQHHQKKTRRRRVVVATVLFDSHNRVLVSSIDGTLPMCDIASLELEDAALARAKSRNDYDSVGSSLLGMDLTTGHDAFIAALKTTWMWRQVSSGDAPYAVSTTTAASSSWNAEIGNRTGADSLDMQQRRPSAVSGAESTLLSTFVGHDRPLPSNVARFLDRFNAAAHSLAVAVTGSHSGLSRLGVMYDRILTTGYVKIANFTGSEEDLTVAKGQLIFMVRRVTSSSERSDLLSRNFLFADSAAVAGSVHKALAVPLDHTMALLEDLRQFCDVTTKVTVKPGRLYAGVSIIQPTPFDGLRILIDEANRSQLPMREIATLATVPSRNASGQPDADLDATVDEIGHALQLLEGISLFDIITRDRALRPYIDRQDMLATQLMSHTETALVPMLDSILSREDMAYVLPRLIIHPTVVPLGPSQRRAQVLAGNLGNGQQPFLIVFRATFDAAVNTYSDKWVPFSLYRAQSKCIMWKGQSLALTPTSTLESPVREIDAAAYFSTHRRPSKVQFEGYPTNDAPAFSPAAVPDLSISDYAFPPQNPANHDLAIRIPRRSSLAQSHLPSDLDDRSDSPTWPRSGGVGVANWDPDWLDHMIRDRSGS